MDLIFNYSRWIFETDSEMAFQVRYLLEVTSLLLIDLRKIFTSEDVELPREAVADYLEHIDLHLCAKYLEFIIAERHEESPHFHDRLAELYLDMTLRARNIGDDGQSFSICVQCAL
jgi:hypothetical protein